MRQRTKKLVVLALGLFAFGIIVPTLKADSIQTDMVIVPSNMFFPLIPSLFFIIGMSEIQIDNSIIAMGSLTASVIVILRLSARD